MCLKYKSLTAMVSGKRGTVAEISNAQAKSLSTHGGLVYLFHALEIQITRSNGQWKMRDSS